VADGEAIGDGNAEAVSAGVAVAMLDGDDAGSAASPEQADRSVASRSTASRLLRFTKES
jgi:hypothetical protein